MIINETKVKGPHQDQKVYTAGKPLAEAKGAMLLIHGRGAPALSILSLGEELAQPDLVYLAPQAANYSWYPYSFLAPLDHNEPGLSSGLAKISEVVAQIEAAGLPAEKIIIAGFSQGACLASEFVARNARRYGGLLVFSGGLIGPPGTPRDYQGTLEGTRIFLGCSDIDPHIPEARVHETAGVFERLGAQVVEKIYSGMGHTIVQDEIDEARQIVQAVVAA
jgi:predicted esterase